MRHSTLGSLFITAALVAPALAARPAAAALYYWTAAGTTCQPIKADAGKVNYTGIAALNESTSASAKVVCPVPYEYGTFTSATFAPTIEVKVIDPNTAAGAARVSCTAAMIAANNKELFSSTRTVASPSANYQSLSFYPPLELFQGDINIVVTCTLPKGPAAATRAGVRGVRLYRS